MHAPNNFLAYRYGNFFKKIFFLEKRCITETKKTKNSKKK